MRGSQTAAGIIGAAALMLAGAASAGPRVAALDQCADQFVLALSPRPEIAGLSYRAQAPDSYLRGAAKGLPRLRTDLESLLAARPQVVVREWGGDPALIRRLQAQGVRVVGIEDAADFDGVRANIRRVAAALGRGEAGEALVSRMDAQLAAAAGAWRGRRGLYLTPGGFTAGPATLVGAMMRTAGMTDAASSPGFAPAPLESLVLHPPEAVVLGFFDRASVSTQHWSLAGHPVLARTLKGHPVVSLPGAILGCAAWFAADGAQALAAAARP